MEVPLWRLEEFQVTKFVAHIGPLVPPYLDGAFPLEAPTLSFDVRPHHLRRGVILRQVGSMLML